MADASPSLPFPAQRLPLPRAEYCVPHKERIQHDAAACRIAGFALCRPYIDMGWVDELGVLRPWRRKGLGLALLHHAFQAFHARGFLKIGLGVDAQSLTGATRLYERAGMRPFRQWDTYQKELRPGVELTTRPL